MEAKIRNILQRQVDGGKSIYRIQKDIGTIGYSRLREFIIEGKSLTVPNFEKICEHLGWQLTRKPARKSKSQKK